jgi:hypothetical protein
MKTKRRCKRLTYPLHSIKRWLPHSHTTRRESERSGKSVSIGTSSSAASCSTHRPRRETRAESLCDSDSVEIVITSPTKHLRTHARAQVSLNRHAPVKPCVSPRRMGQATTQKRAAHGRRREPSDESEPEDSDDKVDIVVDAPLRVLKVKPQPQPKSKSRRSSEQHPASTPPPVRTSISVYTSSPSSSPPPSSPRQLARRSPTPTNDPPSSRVRRDRSTAARPEPPTNVARSSFRRQQNATDATACNPAGFFL